MPGHQVKSGYAPGNYGRFSTGMYLPCIINNGFCLFKAFQTSRVLSVGLTMDIILFFIEQRIEWWYKQPGWLIEFTITTVCLLMRVLSHLSGSWVLKG